MRMTIIRILISICLFSLCAQYGISTLLSVKANVRGKIFEVKCSTVQDFISQVEQIAELQPGKQSVMFNGKVLLPSKCLSDIGVHNGDVLNVLKGLRLKPTRSTMIERNSNEMRKDNGLAADNEQLFDQLKENILKANPELIEKAKNALDQMLDSDVVQKYLSDGKMMEDARLQLLENIDRLDHLVPGQSSVIKEMVSDPVKWENSMAKVRQQIEVMRKLKEET